MTRSRTYNMRVNWRQVKSAVTSPSKKPAELLDNACSAPEELVMFLPASAIDVRTIRDWLHDPQTIDGRYDLVGRYRYEREKFQTHVCFEGILVVFRRITDALHFKMFLQSLIGQLQVAA